MDDFSSCALGLDPLLVSVFRPSCFFCDGCAFRQVLALRLDRLCFVFSDWQWLLTGVNHSIDDVTRGSFCEVFLLDRCHSELMTSLICQSCTWRPWLVCWQLQIRETIFPYSFSMKFLIETWILKHSGIVSKSITIDEFLVPVSVPKHHFSQSKIVIISSILKTVFSLQPVRFVA